MTPTEVNAIVFTLLGILCVGLYIWYRREDAAYEAKREEMRKHFELEDIKDEARDRLNAQRAAKTPLAEVIRLQDRPEVPWNYQPRDGIVVVDPISQ